MNLKIKLKDTATLERIAELNAALLHIAQVDFPDVIESFGLRMNAGNGDDAP